jgi:hypothetical protein
MAPAMSQISEGSLGATAAKKLVRGRTKIWIDLACGLSRLHKKYSSCTRRNFDTRSRGRCGAVDNRVIGRRDQFIDQRRRHASRRSILTKQVAFLDEGFAMSQAKDERDELEV